MEKQKNLKQYIKIRTLKMDDYETVVKWSKDKSFCEANGWEKNRKNEELYSWWTQCVNSKSTELIRLGIEFKGKLIGYGDIACMKENAAEIGIAIGNSSLWGKGIGYHSTLMLMDYAFNELMIKVFNAETHEANTRSKRMLENLGFKEISRIGMEQYMGVESKLIQYRICV